MAIDTVTVGEGHLEALVRVSDARFARSSAMPGAGARAASILPGLARHRCENGTAHGVLRELDDTESPHLLEHLAVELMALSGSPRTLRALTTWDFARDGRGVFRVRLEFDDDLVALGALREALTLLPWILAEQGERPDGAAAAERLRALRQQSDG